jgi:hypothetical protein
MLDGHRRRASHRVPVTAGAASEGDHRPRGVKSGHFAEGDHRLGAADREHLGEGVRYLDVQIERRRGRRNAGRRSMRRSRLSRTFWMFCMYGIAFAPQRGGTEDIATAASASP